MKQIKQRMICKMIEFYKGNLHDIEHFLKVYTYASLIGGQEDICQETQDILEMAAIVHDISCPYCREKYGSADGRRQEQESEALLRPFLEEFALSTHMQERIIYLICHHHTDTDVDGLDYRILLEADFLVNASEGALPKKSIESFRDQVFRTKAGIALLNSIYFGK